MSSFPELQRIERAIKSKEERQLRWAMEYCESRLKQDADGKQQADWQALLERVKAAMAELRPGR